MTTQVYQNRQRTSTRNGILKSEAVYIFSKTLAEFGVNTFKDIQKINNNSEFESRIKQIPGQTSGISLRYFFMLTGDDSYIKPDRMIQRFIFSSLKRNINYDVCQELISSSMKLLLSEYPQISPRLLDNLIWSFQRVKGYDFSNGKRGAVIPLPAGKEKVTIRLDSEILEWFRRKMEDQGGGDYQEDINEVLRKHIANFK